MLSVYTWFTNCGRDAAAWKPKDYIVLIGILAAGCVPDIQTQPIYPKSKFKIL